MQSLKAAAIVLAAASLCAAQEAPPPRELRVEFEGNRVFTSEQLRGAAIRCYEAGRRKAFDAEALDYCLRKEAVNVMRRAGYVRAQFGQTRTASLGDAVTVTVPVEEGEFYRVGRVNVVGAAHFDAKQLRELLPLKRGDIADTTAVGRWAFEYLKSKYADEGFIQYDAEIEPDYRVAHGATEGVVNLTVTVNEGKQFRLRRLEFKAEGYVPEEELRAALGVKEGEVFRQQEYADGVQRLCRHKLFDSGDGRFEEIDGDRDIELHGDEVTGDLDITIRLTEKGQERANSSEARPGSPTLARRP